MASLLVAGDPWFAAFSPRFPAWPGPLVDGCRWVIACDSLFAASRALHADVACRLLAHPRLPLYLQYDLRAHRESQRDVPAFFSLLEKHAERLDIPMIDRALRYAAAAHRGQKRMSGEDFVEHSIAVASILAGLLL